MRRTIRHGAVMICDLDKCANTFTTYSMASLARKQAAQLGWGQIKLNMLEDWKDLELGSDGRKKLDACVDCLPIVVGGHAARTRKRIEDRAARKSTKATKAAKRTPKVPTDQPAAESSA